MRRRKGMMNERDAERLFARLRDDTPTPSESDLRSLARAAATSPRPVDREPSRGTRRIRGPRLAAVAVAVALLLGSGVGFGLGSSVTSSGSAEARVVGFGFLPARGWTVVQSGTFDASGKATAVAANTRLEPEDGAGRVPSATLEALPAGGVLIFATFTTRGDVGVDIAFPARTLPLELDAAVPARDATGVAPRLTEHRLRAGVRGYNVDARVFFGSARPTASMLGSAQLQLNRLVVASERVTIFARPSVLAALEYFTLFGSVDNGRANEIVEVQARECGSSSSFFLGVVATRTEDGGSWSTRRFAPRITTSFRAVWNGTASAQVTVRRRAEVGLRRLGSGRRFEVSVGGRQFWRKHVLIQRFDRRLGTWTTVRKVVLNDQGTGPGASAGFTVRLPAGTLVRAVVPGSQARPCYLSGTSTPLRT